MLSSFLLSRSTIKSGEGNVDNALDAIFAASAKSVPLAPNTEQPVSDVTSTNKTSKRKRKDDSEASVKPPKKHKPSGKGKTSTTEETTFSPLHQDDDIITPVSQSSSEKRKRKDSKKHRAKAIDHPIGDLKEMYSNQRLEEAPPKRKEKHPKIPSSELVPTTTSQQPSNDAARATAREASNAASSDDDAGAMNLVHESISRKTLVTRRRSVYIPEAETKTQRDERTIFIGNLPFGILKSKPLQKALKRHIISFTPGHPESGTKIESIRFRSVAFKAPTNPRALKEEGSPAKQPRQQVRAFSWRIGKEEDAGGEGPKPKVYLSPAEKKRVAFIKGEFHEQAASVNAYAVIAYEDPTQALSSGSADSLEPAEIATTVVEQMDGTQFEGRTLRVDRVAVPDQSHGEAVLRDPASTIFVGNLEFTAHEEDLRTFFETLLASEMGPPKQPQMSTGESEELDQKRTAHWVSNVRIIRDKDTQLGKGFGYVRFAERTCVDEVVAMDPVKLKFAKRKLRVNRCKVTGEKSTSSAEKSSGHGITSGTITSPRKVEHPTLPKVKGDPKLGERLKGMSKEERRKAKKQDPNRLARRMEKKKARISLEKSMKKPDKERIRVRKATTVKTAKKKPTKRTPT